MHDGMPAITIDIEARLYLDGVREGQVHRPAEAIVIDPDSNDCHGIR